MGLGEDACFSGRAFNPMMTPAEVPQAEVLCPGRRLPTLIERQVSNPPTSQKKFLAADSRLG